MGNHNKAIAIIPARSGSKGLKDKNIRDLNGKPLLAYTVEAAVSSGLFDTVHVSTDSQEYADIASFYGADEPFLRDRQNAGDASSSWDAVREVLRKYRGLHKAFETCVLLQPTSPMRNAQDITEAFRLYQQTNALSLTSVTEVDHPVQWCFRLEENHSIGEFARSPFNNSRRQELEAYYRENGARSALPYCLPSFPEPEAYYEQHNHTNLQWLHRHPADRNPFRRERRGKRK